MTSFNNDIERLFDSLTRAVFGPDRFADAAQMECRPGSVCYGYTVTVGPDGRPVMREFGSGAPAPQEGVREPPVDTIVNDKDNTAKLVAEIPGVERGDIDVAVDGAHVTISAERGAKRYRADVDLARGVDDSSTQASYKNGILEITFKFLEEKPRGKKVEVQ